MTSHRVLLLLTLAIMLALTIGACMILLAYCDRRNAVYDRLQQYRASAGPTMATDTKREDMVIRAVTWLGRTLAQSGILPAATVAELRLTLSAAALPSTNAFALFIGSKVVLAGSFLSMGYLAVTMLEVAGIKYYMVPVAGCVVGLILPDMIIKRMRKTYLARVEAGLPDTLDMLVICTDAGLGLEPAIERVGDEIGYAHPAMATELKLTARELRLNADRRAALANMGARTGIDGLRRLGSTLIQTSRFGTPLGHALRTLSSEMRQESMSRYEARAARLPVLLTVPMILFILPCIFIIVGGPAVLQAMDALGKK